MGPLFLRAIVLYGLLFLRVVCTAVQLAAVRVYAAGSTRLTVSGIGCNRDLEGIRNGRSFSIFSGASLSEIHRRGTAATKREHAEVPKPSSTVCCLYRRQQTTTCCEPHSTTVFAVCAEDNKQQHVLSFESHSTTCRKAPQRMNRLFRWSFRPSLVPTFPAPFCFRKA